MANGKSVVAQVRKSKFALPAVGPTEQATSYALGVLPGLPFHAVHFGGVAFVKYCNPPVGLDINDEGVATPQRAYTRGDVLRLTATQVTRILDAVAGTVYRAFSGGPTDEEAVAKGERPAAPRGMILRTGGAYYKRQTGDEPIAKFLFMFELDKASELGIDPRWQTDQKVPIPSIFDMADGAEENEPAADEPKAEAAPTTGKEVTDGGTQPGGMSGDDQRLRASPGRDTEVRAGKRGRKLGRP